jgi:formylglycine-generating enzyme required for sulfatase activity
MMRFPILLVVLAALAAAPASNAQELILRGGPSILADPTAPEVEAGGVSGFAQVGARFWLTDLFQVQTALGYDNRFTAEGALYVRPFANSPLAVEPYAFAGVGTQFESGHQVGVVPVGIGLQYLLGSSTGIFLEMAGRWHYRKDPTNRINDLDFSFAPTVGVSFDIGRRPAPFFHATRNGDRQPPADLYARQDPPATDAPAGDRAADDVVLVSAITESPAAAWGNLGGRVQDAGDQMALPDGTFIMGLTDEDPLALQTAGLKRVTVSGFYLDKTEVTNGAYREWLRRLSPEERARMTPDASAWERARSSSSFESYFESGRFDEYPVVAVDWHQAQAFCAASGGRLPTEAEWEYAARSGQPGGIFPWPGFEARAPDGTYLANFNPGRGLYAADGYAFTAPVDAFPASPWGLHHMAGNAAEWVADAYTPSYAALSNFNPRHEDAAEPRRVVRGGSWASEEFYIGVGVRDVQKADEATIYTGFRCAYDLAPEDRQRVTSPALTNSYALDPAR